MEILSINAENALASLASSIGRDPESWEGWHCLNFEMPKETDGQGNCLNWVKNVIESYLKDANGRVFFCNDRQIYIICKGVACKNLGQVAQLICDLLHEDSSIEIQYKIYDLGKDGPKFASMFFERCNVLDFNAKEYADILDKSHEHAIFSLVGNNTEAVTRHFVNAPRVLLVEDDPITRFMVRKAIKNECVLATAPEGNKVFSLYASYQPDIVFLDINLPDLNGYDVLEWIMDNDPGACVVMFSSNSDMDNIVSSMDYGAKGFVSKPFSKEKLLHYIHNHTG
ncbi:MAG: response regulator [Rhodospirillales bacterium]|nr:response regulator [Alphaproteobacteria bacterium]MCB9981503.1 response regulator [Rhodospirillales bacterium]